MGLKVLPVQTDSDSSTELEFASLIRTEHAAFSDPFDHILNLFGPCLGTDPSDRQAALEGLTARQHGLYRAQSDTATWIEVVDDTSGELLGGAEWHFYHDDPYRDDGEVDCFWFEEGEARTVANEVMSQYLASRRRCMNRPHAFLDICFTKPDARRRGVGRMLVEWGLQRADELNYGTYVDSSDIGRHLYENCGFVLGEGQAISRDGFSEAQRNSQVGRMLLPLRWWPMYRPAKGRGLKGLDELPWSGARDKS